MPLGLICKPTITGHSLNCAAPDTFLHKSVTATKIIVVIPGCLVNDVFTPSISVDSQCPAIIVHSMIAAELRLLLLRHP
jgi:hypothetical protein